MGFNISTGKLGQITNFATTTSGEDLYTTIEIDIPRMIRERTFDVPIGSRIKQDKQTSGTIVEIASWWPLGHMNQGFVNKLIRTSKVQLREQLGRRYSTLLAKNLTIILDNEKCPVFHHCVWSEKRYVEHQTHGKIHAKTNIDALLNTELRCEVCTGLIEENQTKCPSCGAEDKIRKIEHRLKGWVGIQRFDHPSQYGIDLIRNGRAIRVSKVCIFLLDR